MMIDTSRYSSRIHVAQLAGEFVVVDERPCGVFWRESGVPGWRWEIVEREEMAGVEVGVREEGKEFRADGNVGVRDVEEGDVEGVVGGGVRAEVGVEEGGGC